MTARHPQQQGMALVEALIASAILGIGLVGATQLTLKTLNTATQNRQQTVAQILAQEAMDCLRAQALLSGLATSGTATPGQTNTAPCPGEETRQIQGVTYTRQTRSTSGGAGVAGDLHVRVSWPAPGQSGPPASIAASTAGSSGAARLVEWHSSASALPTWVGVSLP
jgi:type II secretory pathway pseudopilin PulG